MKKHLFLTLSLLLVLNLAFGQKQIPLWPNGVPNSQSSDEVERIVPGNILWVYDVQEPSIEVYLPAKNHANGKAMIICPGGGYNGLAYDWEGQDIAKYLNSQGIAAFVLKYRLPKSKSVIVRHEAPLQDAQRAIRLVRSQAEEWNIETDQIGIMGFSAGGHLASTAGTHYNTNTLTETDEIDELSARPDFLVLMYPVITLNETSAHMGSRRNLIGETPTQELIDLYSNELQITSDTPPTFLLHAGDDNAVPVANSLLFYEGLIKAGVKSEMHIYPEGGHGFALAIGKGNLQTWPGRLSGWLESLK